MTLIWKEKLNIVWKEKNGRSGSNWIILNDSNVSNRMILFHYVYKTPFLENKEIVTFKISCRPYFQDKYFLMFAGMFFRVLLLFRTNLKWFSFFTYLIWIRIFTTVKWIYLLTGIWYWISGTISLVLTRQIFGKSNFCDTYFDVDLFSQIAKCRFFAWICFRN